MVELALGFGGLAPTKRTEAWEAWDRFILELAAKGWKRGDVYRLLAEVQNEEYERLPEEACDALYDYETGLLGDCSHDCIVRLPGEPEAEQAFIEYVYAKRWLKEG